ncbi:hypothetical protein [Cecembia rubra]|uniref:hypothetical protein n=1 Tax=Cecembia rubra TaxID=1485585 RepID=UPI0027150011|nr:hypothetical protein [Cecembia rubra]
MRQFLYSNDRMAGHSDKGRVSQKKEMLLRLWRIIMTHKIIIILSVHAPMC